MNTFDPNHQHSTFAFVVGQKVVIFNDADEVLFLKRSDKTDRAGGWDFPGGRLENEDPFAGIVREVREETQLKIKDLRPVAVVTNHTKEPNLGLLVIGYTAKWESGDVQLSWEHDEFKWLDAAAARQLELPAHHKIFLEKAIYLATDTV